MRRAIIALLTASALMLTGLIPGPLRVTALGETSVTLNCTDGTSVQLVVDAEALAGLTAAVQGMIDYPADLGCTLVQNPLPLTTVFGHVALAATSNTFVVAGGRWLVECTAFFKAGAATLTVFKHVHNRAIDSSMSVAANFEMTVSGTAVPGPNTSNTVMFPGSETGTPVPMRPGDYVVTETTPPGTVYAGVASGDCNNSLQAGDSKTCTWDNFESEVAEVAPAHMIASPVGSKFASLAATSSCNTGACVWVNIAVNLHYRDKTNILEGTLNETIPEHQSCPNPNDPTKSIAVGPSHFTSKPNPGCLFVDGNRAVVTTQVTQTSGLPFPTGVPVPPDQLTGLRFGDAIHFSFIDVGNPGANRPKDQLNGPPALHDSNCEGMVFGTLFHDLENGNINVHP
jgi:hypothetical protein